MTSLERQRFAITPRLLVGLAALSLGLLFTLENLHILDDAEDVLRFWPVVLIVAGVVRLALRRSRPGGYLFGPVLIAVGTWLVLDELRWVDGGWDQVWPILLVTLGISLVWEAFHRADRKAIPIDTDSTFHTLAVFCGIDRKISSSDFQSGEVMAVMGGADIDLRPALISGGAAEIFVFAMCGGVNIMVPDDWAVTNRGFAFMGGFADKCSPPRGGSGQRLIVKGLAFMGGVEVRNRERSEEETDA